MAETYMTPETRRLMELQGIHIPDAGIPGVYLDIGDMTGPDGRISSEAIGKSLAGFGQIGAAAGNFSDQIAGMFGQEANFNNAARLHHSSLKTPEGQEVFVLTGNMAHQDKESLFSLASHIPKEHLDEKSIPGDAADWAEMLIRHEQGHMHGQRDEWPADRHAMDGYRAAASDPNSRLDPAVPEVLSGARALSVFGGTPVEDTKEAAMEVGQNILMKQVDSHETIYPESQGYSKEEASAAIVQARTMEYSMATQAEITRLGGMDAFNRAHPDMAGQVYQDPSQAFDGAWTLMEAQNNPDLLKDPEHAPDVAKALGNATAGAQLLNGNPELAYATAQAIQENEMVPKDSAADQLFTGYRESLEKYAPDAAEAGQDLGAEVAANFDNTVSKDAIAESNAQNFPQPEPEATPELEPEPDPVPDSQSAPALDDDESSSLGPTYNSGTSNSWAPSFG